MEKYAVETRKQSLKDYVSDSARFNNFLLDWDFIDTYRIIHPNSRTYSRLGPLLSQRLVVAKDWITFCPTQMGEHLNTIHNNPIRYITMVLRPCHCVIFNS